MWPFCMMIYEERVRNIVLGPDGSLVIELDVGTTFWTQRRKKTLSSIKQVLVL